MFKVSSPLRVALVPLSRRTFNFHRKEAKQLALGVSWGWSTQEVMTSLAANQKAPSRMGGAHLLPLAGSGKPKTLRSSGCSQEQGNSTL